MTGASASSRRCVALAATTLSIMTLTSGCTTLGGNVKGSFSCQAPDGICAPSSVIDDRALAMISSDAGDMTIPAGPFVPAPGKPQATKASFVATAAPVVGQPDGGRTQDRVLRIVFMPYVDDRGRLHEASAVHAVVQQAEWKQEAMASATPLAAPGKGPTLAEAVDQASIAYDVGAFDPNMSDSAIAAAARPKGPDPLTQLKADVATKLALSKPRPIGIRAMQETVSLTGSVASSPRPILPTDAAAGGTGSPAVAAAALAGRAVPTVTAAGAQAVASVKANPIVQGAASQAQQLASQGAGQPTLPPASASTRPVIKAASFPGVEGN